MDIHLITQEPSLLDVLVKTAQSAKVPVASALCRKGPQALAPLLVNLPQGLLLLDQQALQGDSDWSVLSAFTQRNPQISVVLLSNDVHEAHLMQAMRAGIREILPSPPTSQALQATWLRFSEHRLSSAATPKAVASNGKMIAFIACKGGAGATFLSTSMAHMLATEFKRECTFVDMDFLYGDASFYLGSMKHPNTVSDLTGETARLDAALLESCLYSAAPGLQVLAAPEDMGSALAIQANQMAMVLTLARTPSRWVLVDLPRNMDAMSLKALDMADVICMVMDSSIAALRDAKRLLQLMQSLGYGADKLRLILNKNQQEQGVDQKSMEEALGITIEHTVPAQFDEVSQCIHLGQAIGQLHPKSPITQALRKIASQLLDMPTPKPEGWWARWLHHRNFSYPLTATGAPLENRHS